MVMTLKLTALGRRLRFIRARWERLVGRYPCTDPRGHQWTLESHGENVCQRFGARLE
jgi:hypothetical protein